MPSFVFPHVMRRRRAELVTGVALITAWTTHPPVPLHNKHILLEDYLDHNDALGQLLLLQRDTLVEFGRLGWADGREPELCWCEAVLSHFVHDGGLQLFLQGL